MHFKILLRLFFNFFATGWSYSHEPSVYFDTFYSVYFICIPPASSESIQCYRLFLRPSKSYWHGEWAERTLSGSGANLCEVLASLSFDTWVNCHEKCGFSSASESNFVILAIVLFGRMITGSKHVIACIVRNTEILKVSAKHRLWSTQGLTLTCQDQI